jgi:hypothetical protein
VRRAAALAALAALVLVATAWSSAAGTVRVTLDDRMTARPIEGYVWFVGLDRAQRVSARSVPLRGTGRHLLVSFIRSCDGNCGLLDPPSMRCSQVVTLHAGSTRRALVRLRNSGCRIVLR